MNHSVKNDGSFSFRLLRIAMTAALGGFLFGFDSAIINGTVISITNEFSLSATMTGFAVSCALLGAMLGAWGAGYSANKYGRVKTMIFSSILLSISALGSGLAESVESLILWRFIGGLGVGVASVIAPAYISEIAPSNIRGRMATMQQMSLVTGIFFALLISTVLVRIAGSASSVIIFELEAWRWMFLSELIPSILYGILAINLPESPRYLIQEGNEPEARLILRDIVRIKGQSTIDETILRIKRTFNSDPARKLADLKDKKYLLIPIVWVGIMLSVFQQLVGINVIFYFSTVLWNSVGFDESNSFTISVFMSVTNIVATIIAIALIDKLGRKVLLLSGSAVMTVSLSFMAIAFSHVEIIEGKMLLPEVWGTIALIAANLFIIGFGASWGPVVWVLLGEMFPNRIRAIALGLGAAAQWLANFIVSTTFPILAELGLHFAYGLYALSAFISLIFVFKYVKETNGVSLENMELSSKSEFTS